MGERVGGNSSVSTVELLKIFKITTLIKTLLGGLLEQRGVSKRFRGFLTALTAQLPIGCDDNLEHLRQGLATAFLALVRLQQIPIFFIHLDDARLGPDA